MRWAAGSIRIHDAETQSRMFQAIGIGSDEAREKFGFLLDRPQLWRPPPMAAWPWAWIAS